MKKATTMTRPQGIVKPWRQATKKQQTIDTVKRIFPTATRIHVVRASLVEQETNLSRLPLLVSLPTRLRSSLISLSFAARSVAVSELLHYQCSMLLVSRSQQLQSDKFDLCFVAHFASLQLT